jgi:hypothetical protein
MWIATKDGLLSAVQSRKSKGLMVVRGRNRRHLVKLAKESGRPIHRTDDADYPYRVFVSRSTLATFLVKEVLDINYANFKDSVKDKQYSDFLLRTWAAGLALERKGERIHPYLRVNKA